MNKFLSIFLLVLIFCESQGEYGTSFDIDSAFMEMANHLNEGLQNITDYMKNETKEIEKYMNKKLK
ncbi:unnamed protein product, partial [Gordionus sp. m RMFG-2023]